MSCVLKDGYLSIKELMDANRLPSDARYSKGAVAVLECCQEIPCNPCEDACPFGAIHVGSPITNLPTLDENKCMGCGTCIAHCSGLAIFVVDKTYSELQGSVSFPYEYLPLPQKGQKVTAVNRAGKEICEATVVRVLNTAKNDHTPVVTIAVDKEFVDEARGIKRLNAQDCVSDLDYVYEETDPDSVIVCRCEEVTVGAIRKAIRDGASSITEVKRQTRAGMGLCQGRTCSKIIARMIATEKGLSPSEVREDTARPPMKPVKFGAFVEDKNE